MWSRALAGCLVWLGLLSVPVSARVFWNPGDPIPRHDLEFAELQRTVASWEPPVEVLRVDCPPRLEDEILYVRDRYANDALDLSLESNRLDIFRVEASWLRAMEDSLLDLRPILGDALLAGFDPRSVDALTVNGKLLALPSFLDGTVLYYRRDLLEKYNFSVPRTWDELEAAARAIQRGERAAGALDFWSLMWQGKDNEILTMLTYAFVGSHGGGSFVNASGDIDIQNPQAAAALDRVRHWIHNAVLEDSITPARVINQHLHESKLPFLQGQSAFLLDLSHIGGEMHSLTPQQGSQGPSIASRVSYTHMPGATSGQGRTTAWFWGWGVNRHSPELNETLRVLRHLASRQQQLFKARHGDHPTLLELQQDTSATCGGVPEPNICTLPISELRFVDRHLPSLGTRYFALKDDQGHLQPGVSPIIFSNMQRFLKEKSFTVSDLLATWKCDLALTLGKSEQEHCQPCSPGYVRLGVGGCSACPMGFHAPAWGSRTCERCPMGRYSNATGRESCTACEDGTSTRVEAATSASFCECPRGSYLPSPPAGQRCVLCTEGLHCDGGSSPPTISPGYMSLGGAEALAPLRCSEPEACLGGAPGGRNCRGARSGVACAECPAGTQPDADGGCAECTAVHQVVPWLVGIPVLIGFYMLSARDSLLPLSCDTTTLTAATIGASVIVATVQALGNLNTLRLPFGARGVGSAMDVAMLLLLSPGTMGVACMTSSPLSSFALRSFLPFGALLVLPVLHASNVLSGGKLLSFLGPGWSWTTCVDLAARFFTLSFIVIMSTAAEPFQCLSHPPPSGRTNMVAYPGVLCFESGSAHAGMLGFSAFSVFCLAAPCMAICAWASLIAPRKLLDQGFTGVHALAFKSILQRFRPRRWWWFTIYILRQVLLAVVVVVQPNDPGLGCCFAVAVLMAYAGAVAWFKPWRTQCINTLEVSCFELLALLLAIVGISFQPVSVQVEVYRVFAVIVVVLLCVVKFLFAVYLARAFALRGLMGVVESTPNQENMRDLAQKLLELSLVLTEHSVEEVEHFVTAAMPAVREDIGHLLYMLEVSKHDTSARLKMRAEGRKTKAASVVIRDSFAEVMQQLDNIDSDRVNQECHHNRQSRLRSVRMSRFPVKGASESPRHSVESSLNSLHGEADGWFASSAGARSEDI